MFLVNYGSYLLYAVIYFMFALALKFILDYFANKHREQDQQESSSDNRALGLRRGAAQIGLAIAISGVLSGEAASSLWLDLILSLIYALLALMFMLLSLLITDKIILPKVNNTKALRQGNMSVAFIEAGALIMTGLLARAAILGEQSDLIKDLSTSIIYFVLGQIVVVILVWIYEFIRSGILFDNIKAGKISAGIYLGAKVIAYGFILQSAVSGDAVSLKSGLIDFAIIATIGMVLLVLFEWLIDKYLVTHTTVDQCLNDDKVADCLQFSLAKIGMAIILGTAVI